mgnify:FL=1
MSNATLALADLATSLTAVAPVLTGRAALETTSADLPVITIWSTEDRPTEDPDYGYPLQFTRTATIECKIAATATYHTALDTTLTAIRQVLRTEILSGAPLGGYATALRQNGARFFAPAEGSEIAVLQVAIELDWLES